MQGATAGFCFDGGDQRLLIDCFHGKEKLCSPVARTELFSFLGAKAGSSPIERAIDRQPEPAGSGGEVLEVGAVEEFAVGEDLDVAEPDRDDQQDEVDGGHASDAAVAPGFRQT